VPRGIAASAFDAELGARVRDRRRSLRMSQTALGERLDVSFQQVQKYECGTNRISVSSLIVIAEALQCSVDDLLLSEASAEPVEWGKFADREANEAVEAFSRIPSRAVRREVLQLMRAFARD